MTDQIKTFVAEIVPGLTEFARREIEERLRHNLSIHHETDDEIMFTSPMHGALDKLSTVSSLYMVEHYSIPRPKALMGDQHFRRLTSQIQTILDRHPKRTFRSFHLAAAGADSSVMLRLKGALSDHFHLVEKDDAGDLHLRIRHPHRSDEWEVLVRLTPRPLITRSWRVCDMPGALNAVVAHIMSRIATPNGGLLYNLASGSGSIAIEHALRHNENKTVCVELDLAFLQCALDNIQAANVSQQIQLLQGDAAATGFADESFDALCADLPFGQRVGTHKDNIELYPAIFRESARVARRGAIFVILSHETRLMDSLIRQDSAWSLERSIKITLRGLHPRLYVLRRR